MTIMNKSLRLEAVLELARGDTEEVMQEVGRLMNTREAATQRLVLLSDYRNNYHQQMLSVTEGGMDVTCLCNYAAFTDRLGNAVHQQKDTISALEQQLAMGRVNWLEKQRREQSFDILRQRHIGEQCLDEERHVQRDNDRHTAKVTHMRVAQGGN